VKLVHSGKVRELYDAGDGLLLMVTSDRISAYDVIFAEPIPDKGRVLTAMTAFWNAELADLAPSSIVTADPVEIVARVPAVAALPVPAGVPSGVAAPSSVASVVGEPWWAGRALLVRRAEMLQLECIVRGRLAGQAYDEYVASGTVHGTPMPAGLQLADRFAEPIFTPSTKAEEGHDLNIGFDAAVDLVGFDAATTARELSLALFRRAAERAAAAGFVLADTKFELGYVDGALSLCDEVVTPDSSRLWPADQIVPGQTPPAYDKQPLRDWAAAGDWDKRPPPPPLPPDVVQATAERYRAAYERVAGRRLADWYGAPK
jgi:phosphoribosylaminoimidazole-succinocarboxamide synthase